MCQGSESLPLRYVAAGVSGGTINAWSPFGIAWRGRCGGGGASPARDDGALGDLRLTRRGPVNVAVGLGRRVMKLAALVFVLNRRLPGTSRTHLPMLLTPPNNLMRMLKRS